MAGEIRLAKDFLPGRERAVLIELPNIIGRIGE
jgi:hypothetical protein